MNKVTKVVALLMTVAVVAIVFAFNNVLPGVYSRVVEMELQQQNNNNLHQQNSRSNGNKWFSNIKTWQQMYNKYN